MAKKRLAPQIHQLYLGEDRIVSIDCSGGLDAGEALAGTPVVTEVTGALTISQEQVSSVDLVINGAEVPAGYAVQFSVDRNQASAAARTIDVSVLTTSGQTVTGAVRLECV